MGEKKELRAEILKLKHKLAIQKDYISRTELQRHKKIQSWELDAIINAFESMDMIHRYDVEYGAMRVSTSGRFILLDDLLEEIKRISEPPTLLEILNRVSPLLEGVKIGRSES